MKKVVTALLVSATILVACNPGTPDFLDPQNPPNNPVVDSLPYKVVEIDQQNDSAVALMTYTSTGDLKTMDVKVHTSGVVTKTINGSFTYYSDGKLQHGLMRWADPNDSDRMDYYCPKNAAGQLVGVREIDSAAVTMPGAGVVQYNRYAYDSKGRLARIYYDLDSANFFATAFPVNFAYVDSMIYDTEDRLTEWYYRYFNTIQNKYIVIDKGKHSNFEPVKSFIKPGVNAYAIFELESLLGGVPKTLDEQHYNQDGDLFRSFVSTVSVSYDASHRPSVMTITSTPANNYSWNTAMFIDQIKQRKFYYK